MENTKMELLHLLQQDCRIPLEKLSVMLGQPLETVAETLDELEKTGVILRYAPVVNWDRLGKERVEGMIEVRTTPQRGEGFDAIAKRIYRFDEVKSVYLMSGAYDLLLHVEAPTLKELAYFVSTKLSVLENVVGTATHFVLKCYKSDGIIFEEDPRDRRLAVNP
jgi:DNA-binding Lrp family transcriptional regulator